MNHHISYEEFAHLVREQYCRENLKYYSLETINRFFDNDEDARDSVKSGYAHYVHNLFREGQTDEEHLNSCIDIAIFLMWLDGTIGAYVEG